MIAEDARCEYCGRIMGWKELRVNDEQDGWDWWRECSQQAKHIVDHPRDWETGFALSVDGGSPTVDKP